MIDMLNLKRYETFVFDCDGVVLDSNKVKTNAFYRTALAYGEGVAKELVDFHVANGGISRYQKLSFFRESLLTGKSKPSLDSLLADFSRHVIDGLYACDVAAGLGALRAATPNSNWLIVSGGDQVELREVFRAKGLADLFDSGIWGSPDNKDEILHREVGAGTIRQPAIFLGDSKYDFESSSRAGLDFVFLSEWTEVKDWRDWIEQNNLNHVRSIQELNDLF